MDDLIEKLRVESGKVQILIPKTLRLPPPILEEIDTFLKARRGIKESAVLRLCVMEGWSSVKRQLNLDE